DHEQRRRGADVEPVNAPAYEEDQAERSEEQNDLPREAEDEPAEVSQAGDAASGDHDRVAAGKLECEPRRNARERDADGHGVVDPQHVSPQALVDGYRAVATDAARRRVVPVEVRHGNSLSVAGGNRRIGARLQSGRTPDNVESSAGLAAAPDP